MIFILIEMWYLLFCPGFFQSTKISFVLLPNPIIHFFISKNCSIVWYAINSLFMLALMDLPVISRVFVGGGAESGQKGPY